MPQLSPGQARVVDPVLTGIAQGFSQNDLVGGLLFPTIPVGMRAGRVIRFAREDFMQYTNLARAPGEATRRVQFGYSADPFALVDYSLEGALPIEVLQEGLASENGFTVDGARIAMAKAQSIMALRLEIQQAALATTLANYPVGNRITLSGTAQWSDLGAVSNPLSVVEVGKDVVRAATGRVPNTLVMGAAVLKWLRVHPLILDRIKYTGRDVATLDLLASLFGVERIAVGNAITSNDAGTAFTDVWGRHVVLAYTETSSLAAMGTPTYGYTYNLNGYPVAEQPYYDRNSKTWYFPVTRAEAPVIAANTAAYFIQNAVAS